MFARRLPVSAGFGPNVATRWRNWWNRQREDGKTEEGKGKEREKERERERKV